MQTFTQAVTAAPDYANAYAERARAYSALGNLPEAAADYERARQNGDVRATTAGELAWLYYRLGRHQDAITMNRTALGGEQPELWIQFDLALAQLAAGDVEGARSSYEAGMQQAITQVAEARAANRETDSSLWWSLDDAAISLDDLLEAVDTPDNSSFPPRSSLANPDALRAPADELIRKLKSLSVALELTGTPPQGELAAQVSELSFGTDPVYDEEGTLQDYAAVEADTFPYGTDQVVVLFDYAGIRQGQEAFFKVYVNDEEDPSWRLAFPWELDESGSAYKELSLAYSDTFVLTPGEYVIELYVDTQLAARGSFFVAEP